MNANMIFFVLADGHHNSLGLVRSLGKAGYHSKVFLVGNGKGVIKYSKYAKDLSFYQSADQALDEIIAKYAKSAETKFIVTGNDKFMSAIDKRYDELKSLFITYNCAEPNRLNQLMSKVVQNELALKAGLNVPKYEVVKVKENRIPNIPFPVITKAVNSIGEHWKDIVYLCRNANELLDAYRKIECDEIIVQQYIEKLNETGFNGISILGGNEVYLPLQLTYMNTCETSFGNTISLFEPTDKELIAKIKKLIKATGYSGSFSVDLLVGKDAKLFFLEINFRNSGWSFPYTRAGVNLPAIWAESTIRKKLDTSRVNISKLPYMVVDEYLELYTAFQKEGSRIISACKHIFKADALIYWDRDDMRPFIQLVKGIINSHLHLK